MILKYMNNFKSFGNSLFWFSLTSITIYIVFVIADSITNESGFLDSIRGLAAFFALLPFGFSSLGFLISLTYKLKKESQRNLTVGLLGNGIILFTYFLFSAVLFIAFYNSPF